MNTVQVPNGVGGFIDFTEIHLVSLPSSELGPSILTLYLRASQPTSLTTYIHDTTLEGSECVYGPGATANLDCTGERLGYRRLDTPTVLSAVPVPAAAWLFAGAIAALGMLRRVSVRG
jgi:hypothetical protein